jgi:SAM-dependent methyltransferase
MFANAFRILHAPVYKQRLAVVSDLVVPYLKANGTVLDIGCGSGMLGQAVLRHERCPAGVVYKGVEKHKRGNEPIEVVQMDGEKLPFPDGHFDVVILADVLHHEADEDFLFNEAVRVSRKYILIKDHKVEGLLGQSRIALLDRAANDPYGVECTYRYHTLREWRDLFVKRSLSIVAEHTTIDLYPFPYNSVFGKRLQYFAALEKPAIS